MYTTIIHPLRKVLELSIADYIILDAIHRLSNNDDGWCTASSSWLSESFDLSESTIKRSLKYLKERDYIITHDSISRMRKPSEKIRELFCFPKVKMMDENGAISFLKVVPDTHEPDSVKMNQPREPDRVKMTPQLGQNDPANRVKMTHPIYNKNNNKNNIERDLSLISLNEHIEKQKKEGRGPGEIVWSRFPIGEIDSELINFPLAELMTLVQSVMDKFSAISGKQVHATSFNKQTIVRAFARGYTYNDIIDLFRGKIPVFLDANKYDLIKLQILLGNQLDSYLADVRFKPKAKPESMKDKIKAQYS